MDFETECEKFLQGHRRKRSGPRLQRIKDGLGYSEKLFLRNVWFPLFHGFDNLHPEYEVRDYREGSRFIDFAYIEPYFQLAVEIDGFGPHWRDITAWQFTEHNLRQNMLVIDGWHVLRFSHNSVDEQPRLCQQSIQQLVGNWQANAFYLQALSLKEREITRLAARSTGPISAANASAFLQISPKHARQLLHGLVDKHWLVPASGNLRITTYQLHPSRSKIRL